jgi:hypothetical protein
VQGRDQEVYTLAVAKKRVEDEGVVERQRVVDEMTRAKRATDEALETARRLGERSCSCSRRGWCIHCPG